MAVLTSLEYVQKQGLVCPVKACGSDNIVAGDSWDETTTMYYQDVACLDCGATWTDHFRLIGYGELEQNDSKGLSNNLRS